MDAGLLNEVVLPSHSGSSEWHRAVGMDLLFQQ